VLLTSDWYATLRRDDVELLTGGVERITPAGVLGADGVERPADAIIWGTGFQSHDFVAPMEVHGLGGQELNEIWRERPEAYLGISVHGFPNLLVIYGPNTNHGAGSVLFTLECQFNYAIDALKHLRGGNRYLDLRAEVQRSWREEIALRSEATRWITAGCNSWYINDEGVNTNNWPGSWREYRRRTRRIDPADFEAVA
jgi:cation diffusion facilitator CzcD-associated flavoprotein CzcO